jgi:nucleotide-binding universal stress UspA family protein
MRYQDILVHLDDSRDAAARIDSALLLAQATDAHVTGLYVHPRERLPRHLLHELGKAARRARKVAREESEGRAERLFRARADHAGVQAEWRSGTGDAVDLLNLHARYSDLMVVSQVAQGDEEQDDDIDPELPDRVTMESGVPVMVVPAGPAPATIGRHVLVAWNASREASRALRDALPLLEQAERVTVLAARCRGDNPTGEAEPGADIALHLARHGVAAEALAEAADSRDAGDVLLDAAQRLGADLLVMGAYGRPRWREFILGGATRHLLDRATLPVLMSH